MKTIKYFFFVLIVFGCSNEDSEFYNDVFVSIPNLVQIETQPTYAINDVLWINTSNFSRFENEINQTENLDIYKTTGGASSFSFSYVLERKISDGNWVSVNSEANLIKDKGFVIGGEFVYATSVFNAQNQSYDFRSGFKLLQVGEYRLRFGFNSTAIGIVELRSDSVNNNIFLNINSTCSDLNGSGYYNFVVN